MPDYRLASIFGGWKISLNDNDNGDNDGDSDNMWVNTATPLGKI